VCVGAGKNYKEEVIQIQMTRKKPIT